MTLPTRPHAIFSTLQGTQNPNTKPTLQRAKNANAQPTTPADDLSSFVRHFRNISLLYTKARPPPQQWIVEFSDLFVDDNKHIKSILPNNNLNKT